jgi:two-component system, NarL family, nitrate/nitrite response regulator NarL
MVEHARPVTPVRPTRVTIVEDHVLFAEALEMALELNGYDVARPPVPARGGSHARLFGDILGTDADVVIIDLDLGGAGDGGSIIGPLAATGVAVLVVTATLDRARWGECLLLGANGVVAKTAPLSQTLDAVGRIAGGRGVIPPDERDRLVDEWLARRTTTRGARARLDSLTTREAEVLHGLVRGRTVRVIAADHVVAEATVRTQVKSILAKLGVSSQLAAVGLAHEAGWVGPVDPEASTAADAAIGACAPPPVSLG